MNSRPPETETVDQSSEADVPALDPKIQGAIGHALQAHFDQIVSAPLPDRFLVLLAELEAKEERHDG